MFKVIAVDFDGTLCENKWPKIGEANEELFAYLKEEKAKGTLLILWTNRTGKLLTESVVWCSEKGLTFDAVNENVKEAIDYFGDDCRKVFANEYIDDKSCRRFELPYHKKDKSDMSSWAEREVAIACKRERKNSKGSKDDWDYGCACYESALKAFKSLAEDGHSGCSIGITKSILNRLIDGRPLTPIIDTPRAWNRRSRSKSGSKVYQCKRMSSLFKYIAPDGTVTYSDVDRCHGVSVVNPNATYSSGLIRAIIDTMFPIKMPYCGDLSFKVYTEDFLVDKKNGDFDTVGVFYVVDSNGNKTNINRFFREPINMAKTKIIGWTEISKKEYDARKSVKL